MAPSPGLLPGLDAEATEWKKNRPVAKFSRVRFVRELRSAERVSTQLKVEIRPSGSPANNQKLGHATFSRSSHTGRENFATGSTYARWAPSSANGPKPAKDAIRAPVRRFRSSPDTR